MTSVKRRPPASERVEAFDARPLARVAAHVVREEEADEAVEPVVEDADADSEEEIGRERDERALGVRERPGEPAAVENRQDRERRHDPEEEAEGRAARERGAGSSDRPRVEEGVHEPAGEADDERDDPGCVPGHA
jgi:hypothetical protein